MDITNTESALSHEKPLPTQGLLDWLNQPLNEGKYPPETITGLIALGKVARKFNEIAPPNQQPKNPFGHLLSEQILVVNTIVTEILGKHPSDSYPKAIEDNRALISQKLAGIKAFDSKWTPNLDPETMENLFNPPSADSSANLIARLWFLNIREDSSFDTTPRPISTENDPSFTFLVTKRVTTNFYEQQEAKKQGDPNGRFLVHISGIQINSDMIRAIRDWYVAEPNNALEAFNEIMHH